MISIKVAGLKKIWKKGQPGFDSWGNLVRRLETSLRARLIAQLGAVMLALLVISGAGVSMIVYRLEQELWRSRLVDDTRHTAQDIRSFIQYHKSILVSLAENGSEAAFPATSYLEELVFRSPALLEVILLDPDGYMVGKYSRGESLLQNQFGHAPPDWFLSGGSGQLYLSDPLISPKRQTYLILAIPAPGGGVVAARLDMNLLSKIVLESNSSQARNVYIVHQAGGNLDPAEPRVVLAGNGNSGFLRWNSLTASTGERPEPGFEDRVLSNIIVAWVPVELMDWIVVTEVPKWEAYAISRTAWLILIAGMLIIAGLVVTTTDRLLDQQVIQPVQLLQQGARQIELGNLGYRIPSNRLDEIGRLSKTFNQMAASLSERDNELAAKTDILEAEVHERKRAETLLAETNTALLQAHDELEQRVCQRTAELAVNRDRLAELNQDLQFEVANRHRIESILRQSESELRALFAAMNDVVIVYNRDGCYLKVPSTNTPLLYRPPDEMIGKTIEEVLPGEQASLLLSQIHRALDMQQTVSVEYRLEINGQEFYFAGAITPMQEDTVVLVAHDITARKRAEEQLLYDAFHDALTRLPNRALFLDRLGHAIERNRRNSKSLYAVLFLDLDRFKVVNDSLGHNAGDQLLVALTTRLTRCLRAVDTAARLGGDEFVILLEDLFDAQQALSVAERILDELKAPFSLAGQTVYITASIGIVASPPRSVAYELPDDVLRDADIALYRAKALGRARYAVFDASLRTSAIIRLEMESELRAALEREEFQLHYQPIHSLQSDRITGFEALLRWRSTQRGSIPPAEFIPIAEETGLIVPIGEWVLREACLQIRRWQEQFPMDPPLTINVNISGVQFAHISLIEKIEEILRETGLLPICLKLEITESVFMENAEHANAILRRLHELGVQLQIDDFGTGYSSLAYLQRFPIHTIKIDRSFVSRIGMNGDNTEIIKTIVSLAHDLGMEAVAEGVETEEQLSQLKALNCQYVQGYFISRPIEPAGVEELLQTSMPDPRIP